MKIIIKKENLPSTPVEIARKAGYGFIIDRRMDKESFTRRLGSYNYPRLHMYIKDEADRIVFDIHLDQKKASYEGSHMHNAEYDGEIVEKEILRIKKLISDLYHETHGVNF